MRRLRRKLKVAALALLLAWARLGSAQVGTSYDASNVQVSPRIRVGGIPGERTYNSIPQGLAGDRIGGSGTTQTDFIEEAFTINRQVNTALADGLTTDAKIGRLQPQAVLQTPIGRQLGVPFFAWQEKPDGEQVELKAGRFYIDLISASATVIYTDNFNQSEFDRRGRAISSVDLFGQAIFQMTETTRLFTGGEVHWFPFENRVTLSDPQTDLAAGFLPRVNASFLLDHSVRLGPTAEIFFRNDLRSDVPNLGAREAFDLLEGPVGTRPDDGPVRNLQPRQRRRNRFNPGTLIINDTEIGVTALVPSQTRMTASYRREHQWFALGAPGSPQSIDTWRFDLVNERENMRFKPFISFRADHRNNRPGFIKNIDVGLFGPVTDYIDILGRMGVFIDPFFDTKGLLFDFRIRHRPRQSTTHFFAVSRRLTFPDFLVANILEYRLEQVLSPEWIMDFAMQRRVFEPINNTNDAEGVKEDQIDVRFTVIMGDKVQSEFGYSFIHQTQRGVRLLRPRQDSHEFLFDTTYFHSPDLESIVSYRFRRRLSNIVGDSFDENVVLYRLRKSF